MTSPLDRCVIRTCDIFSLSASIRLLPIGSQHLRKSYASEHRKKVRNRNVGIFSVEPLDDGPSATDQRRTCDVYRQLDQGNGGGLRRTVVLSAMLVMKAAMGVMPELNLIKMIADMFGAPTAVGLAMHFMIGTVLWGSRFARLNRGLPSESHWLKGIVFATGAWLIMMIAMMPMAGVGFFGFQSRNDGTRHDARAPRRLRHRLGRYLLPRTARNAARAAGRVQLTRSAYKVAAMILDSTIRCPNCGYESTERMPTDACQFFYDCKRCGTRLRPKDGDCCVFCSFGTVPCPPVQEAGRCCR